MNRSNRARFFGMCAFLAFASVALLVGCQRPMIDRVNDLERQPIVPVTSTKGMVVSETPLASAIGAEVLAKGGNAVDASVAVAFALAVTWPEAGNIGGGGFMMVGLPEDQARSAGHNDSRVWCIDYRETAPAAATPDMFKAKRSRFWHGQVGVPGTVAGLAMAHEKWGSLAWADLIAPSVQLCVEGFEVNEALALSINGVLEQPIVRENPEQFSELRRIYGKPDGVPWQAGDWLKLPELGQTLRTLAEQGPKAFYAGPLAEAIARDMDQNDGLITTQDLADYRAILRPAIHATFQGYDVYAPPPPSAGGLTLAMMLHQLDTFDLQANPRYSPQTLHLMAEAMRRGYHWRARTLGDSDFVDVPFEIGSPSFGELLATTIDPAKATPSETLKPMIPLAGEGNDTTHFSVIDSQGLAVSNTYTIEMSWGSRLITPGTGMILNNEMGDFNREPGVTKTNGQIGTPPNTIKPGKRMLSSQTPTLVMRDNEIVLLTGSPGGRTITNTVFNVLVSHLAYGMPLAEAVDGPRIHHQWFPDTLRMEQAEDADYARVASKLRKMGHDVVPRNRQGSANSISVDPGTNTFTGVADWRRGAAAAAPE